MKPGWKTVKLGEVARFDKFQGFHSGLPYVGLEDIESGTRRFIGSRADKEVQSTTFMFNPNHVLYGRLRPYLRKVLVPDFAGHCSTEIFPILATPVLDRSFLSYWLISESVTKQIDNLCNGARMPRANMEAALELETPLPPLAEQKRIVALLDKAFAGIDTLSSNAKTRSSEALHVFEQERDSLFANSDNKYSETTISDITTRLQYGTSEKSSSAGRYVVLRMGNIQDGEIDYEDLKYTSSQEVIDQYCLKPGDVLFNRTNSPQWVGKSAIYRGEMPAVFAGYNIKIHTIADKVDSEFLTFFLNSDRAMSFGRSTFISSVNQANINAEKLRSYRLPLPPLREQKVIANRLSKIKKMSRELAAIYQNSLTQSHRLKAAILTSAFNGTL
jgi:type I restriction enzyme S subunit